MAVKKRAAGRARAVVFVDAGCLFCRGWVRWMAGRLQRLRRGGAETGLVLQFAPWGGETHRALAGEDRFAEKAGAGESDRIELWEMGTWSEGSEVLGRLGQYLPRPWPLVGRWWLRVPTDWRDGLYDFVARRRGRWFGRVENCALGGAGREEAGLFLP